MKRIIALLLCLIMMLTIPVAAGAATDFTFHNGMADALFQLSGANKAGQEFVPETETISGVKVYLNNGVANNKITVTVYEGSAAEEKSPQLYTEDLTLPAKNGAWYTLSFSKEVAVTPGTLHSFTLHTESSCVWNGTLTNDGDYKALNYDVAAYGGWVRGNITGFEIFFNTESIDPIPIQLLIDQLPEKITLEHEELVKAARAQVDSFSASQQALLTNLDKLEAAEATIERLKEEQAALEEQLKKQSLEEAVAAIGTVTVDSASAIAFANQKAKQYAYENGIEELGKQQAYATLKDAFATYNELVDYVPGDVDAVDGITAADALETLNYTVGNRDLNDKEKRAADVSGDGLCNSSDALMILKYIVNKLEKFPAKVYEPMKEELQYYTKKNTALFGATYASMLDRTMENGYAQTSLNGSYPGMFGRDSSIQILSHIEAGDYDHAALIMQYILDYHKRYDYDYVLHIMLDNSSPYSSKRQADTTFFFLHAWYQYAVKAENTSRKAAFLSASEAQIIQFADHFLDEFYFHDNNLIWNSNLEHSRDGREWSGYDLLTNTYASQAWYEMSQYFATKNPAKAKVWREAADRIVQGIHENLVTEGDGKKFYAELIDVDNNNKLVKGFSWVNLAPMGCDWYGADPEILENTYQMYLAHGSRRYYGNADYKMLEVYTNYDEAGKTQFPSNHVIGKGLAWELMYCKKMGYHQRLQTLMNFIENYSEDMYRETWVYTGGGSDTANQEHASWMLYANMVCHPELQQKASLQVATYNIHILSDADVDTIAKDITDAGLEVVGIQEVDKNTNRTGKKDQAKLLADKLGWYYGYSKAIDLEGGEYGHAILSKYPITSYTTTLLTSTGEEQRVFGHAVISVDGKMVNVLNTHTTWTGLQTTQFSELANYVKNLDNFIITGDFNCSNFSAYDVFGGQIVNNATETFITNSEDGAIDNIVVSNAFSVGDGTMVDNNHSDHNMLYADVYLK